MSGVSYSGVSYGGASTTAVLTSGITNVKDVGAKGDGVTDDTAAVQAAIIANSRVYFPAGTYMVADLKLRANVEIFGDGHLSVLKYNGSASTDNLYLMSTYKGSDMAGVPATGYDPEVYNMRNVRIHDIKFLGNMGGNTFVEHHYLLNINATTDMQVDRCWFENWVGDAIYIGSGTTSGMERHNFRVSVRDCVFDGKADGTATNCNRQGISIIDGTDITVERCHFKNIGRKRGADIASGVAPQMPGAVDIEPDIAIAGFVKIANIDVNDCSFQNIWNGSASLSVFLPKQSVFTTKPKNIRLRNCRVVNGTGYTCAGFSVDQNMGGADSDTESPTDATMPLDMVVENCWFEDSYRAFMLAAVKGLTIKNNVFYNQPQLSRMARADYAADDRMCRSITFEGNTFKRCGDTDNLAFRFFSNHHIRWRDNIFEDCGDLTGAGAIFQFYGTSTFSYWEFMNNKFIRSTDQSGANDIATQLGGTATFQSGCRWLNNLKIGTFGATIVFPTLEGSATYNPASLADGAGVTTTVTVTGAALGDFVENVSFSLDLQGITLTGYVSAANTVSVRFQNESGGILDLASGTIRARVRAVT